MAESEPVPDYAGWLGAAELEPRRNYVCVFIPSLTRDGRPLDHIYWRNETVRTMSKLFGGATAVAGFGGWLDKEKSGHVKEEEILMVVSFVLPGECNRENILELGKLLHRMGREAEQGEIGVLIDGRFLRIQRFDHAG